MEPFTAIWSAAAVPPILGFQSGDTAAALQIVLPFALPPDPRVPARAIPHRHTTRMRFFPGFIFLFAVSLQAAPMLRVVRIAGPATIIVEHDGARSEVRLSGIEVTDPQKSFAYLTWTIGSSWVMVEDGRVYRSPDALLINDDLVRKGFARSTSAALVNRTPAVYLGELNPERAPKPQPPRARAASPSRARPRTPRARPARARRR